jgi:hypothetical protein
MGLPLHTVAVEAARVVGLVEVVCTVMSQVGESSGAAQAEVVTIFTQ